MKSTFDRVIVTAARWAIICAVLSVLLFVVAGTTAVVSLRAYLAVFSALLLITMVAVDPQLARERAHPGRDITAPYLRFASGALFLITVTTAALGVGRFSTSAVPVKLRWLGLVLFVTGNALQTWAMKTNPFFSPVIRIQSEHGHYLIDEGPYRFVRHPGYLAMAISVPASAIAIGSWLGIIPALAFLVVIWYRAKAEERFLTINLAGYDAYAKRVAAGIPLIRSA
jgi:protein-S-isoprenylcysteine O-methyltransferase Ste14